MSQISSQFQQGIGRALRALLALRSQFTAVLTAELTKWARVLDWAVAWEHLVFGFLSQVAEIAFASQLSSALFMGLVLFLTGYLSQPAGFGLRHQNRGRNHAREGRQDTPGLARL